MQNHVGLPLVAHVASGGDVNVGKDVPRYEQSVGVSEGKQLFLSGFVNVKTTEASGLRVPIDRCWHDSITHLKFNKNQL